MNAPKNFHSEEILQKFEDQKSKHLIYSLVLDFLGMSSLFLPLLGEGLDLIYAPIYGVAIYSLYQMRPYQSTLNCWRGLWYGRRILAFYRFYTHSNYHVGLYL